MGLLGFDLKLAKNLQVSIRSAHWKAGVGWGEWNLILIAINVCQQARQDEGNAHTEEL